MARSIFSIFRKKPETRLSDNWDLKGTTLTDLIAQSGGGTVSQKNAMKFTGVLAAVSLRSELLASFPKMIYSISEKGRTEIPDDPLYKILAYQPNPYMNAFTFWELMNTHLDLWGNAYCYITRYGGVASALTPIPPDCMDIKVENGKVLYKVSGTRDPILDKIHPPDRILHFKDISFDGIIGQSRISLANSAISIAQSAEAFGKEFFDKGGNSKGVIETDQQMGDEAFQAFAKRWAANANHGTPILDMGKKYKQLQIPMQDAQFIATREFQLQDIARVFRVPPHLLADLSRATFSNIESSNIQFVTYGLRPMVKRYEHELELKLLGDSLGKKAIRFNLDGILRGDTATRAAYFASLKQNELYTTNEIRKMNGDNPSDDPKADLLINPATSSNTNNNAQN
jgi:HK97 family phage portal protein